MDLRLDEAIASSHARWPPGGVWTPQWAIRASVYSSQGNASAPARLRSPERRTVGRANHPTPASIAAAQGGHMITGQGAVRILRDGACGVAGGTARQQHKDRARRGIGTITVLT